MASNYCFGYSDSDEGDYDPSRECFHLEARGAPLGGDEGTGPAGPMDATPSQEVLPTDQRRLPVVGSAPNGHRRANLEQVKELEAKLDVDQRHLMELHVSLKQEQSAWGDGGAARCRAHDVNSCINKDEEGEHPPLFSRAS